MSSHLGAEVIAEAAIELFAERGVDGVTLADIQKASGHRNRSAITYHFGGKEVLVEALITQIVDDHDHRRIEAFARLDAHGTPPTLIQVLEAAVAPMVDDLGERRTRLGLRMIANLSVDERHMAFIQQLMVTHPGLGRSSAAIAGYLEDLPEVIRIERIVLATSFGMRAFADQARLIDSAAPDRTVLPNAGFTSHIVELLQGLLTAPHQPTK